MAAQGADTKKTKIMYKASLSDQALNEYLEILTDSDLLRYRLDIRTFKTTEKGLRFLETYNKMYLAMKASNRSRRWLTPIYTILLRPKTGR